MYRSLQMRVLIAAAVAGAVFATGPGFRAQEQAAPPAFESSSLGDLRARAIGPAVMSGRIAALDVVDDNPRIIYVGSAGGGVWKSANGGTTFQPVFDDHPMSIGAVAIDQSKPDTVWVGTGEGWTRNSVSIGKGIYKTTDAGRTWTSMGLVGTERFGGIAIHPKQSDTVFACAIGPLWGDGDERGLFKTTDGGKTWKKVLFVDRTTGCADVDIDPQEPSVMYATTWQVRREPYFFTSGGPGSGLYKSTDGGEKWTKISRGLPEGPLGRIAVAIAPSRPGTLYAIVEASETHLYRSDDMGESWRRASDQPPPLSVRARPFYFANLRVDPQDHTRVYNPGLFLSVSPNGGRSFEPYQGATYHSDLHALWINPKDPHHLVLGTDGGVYISRDRGTSWSFVGSLPVSQLYHVTYDMKRPYNVYAGLQDNGSWYGPSRVLAGASIRGANWVNVGVGDGFNVFPDANDESIVYSEYQGAQVRRLHQATGEIKDIRPFPGPGEPSYRFNWNAAFTRSAADPSVLLLGGQYVFRSKDRGDSWTRISPDLTTNDPAKLRQKESGGLSKDNSTAENHCTIVTLAESALEPGVIWAGTDDGNVQVTRDNGKTWTNVVANVPGVPKHTWVSGVEPGRHARGTAFATFDGHRTGDMRTYVFATTDYGRTWKPLAGPGLDGYLHVVRQDLVNPTLMFAGSEFGLYVTVDGGRRWARLTGNLPAVAVYDIAIHPRDHDLILATHGRGVQIIDDITPLRHLTPEILTKTAAVLPARAATQTIPPTLQMFPGDAEYTGPNRPEGAAITYYLKQRHVFGKLSLEVLDRTGRVVKALPAGTRQGINRVYWTMRLDAPKSAAAPGLGARALIGPMVPEGRYTVRLTRGDEVETGTIDLVSDPLTSYPAEARARRQDVVMRLYDMQADLAYLGDATSAVGEALRSRAASANDAALAKDAGALASELDALNGRLVDRSGGLLEADPKLREKVVELYSSVMSYAGAPTASQGSYLAAVEAELKKADEEFAALTGAKLGPVNDRLKSAGLQPVAVPSRKQ
jgi:photosystem II stability/assembly factor-like uncharacterized protein